MPMIVANNLNAIGIQRTLNTTNNALSGSLEKLSTGYKINSGKDDPSGLVISELLRSQANGISRAIQNTQEANNVLSIAEGALSEMNNILTKMRALAIHASNSGVTSAQQVAADQSEVDSSVQTLDRIARTTSFSGDNLLNGNKAIGWESTVLVKDTKDMSMIDKGLTNIQQIFKKQDFQLNINFSGKDADSNDNGQGAKKAFFELTKTMSTATQVNAVNTGINGVDSYTLTSDQAFTIMGNLGSRSMGFAKGTHIGEMVSSINGVSDSTGVKASLIFDSGVTAATAIVGSRFNGLTSTMGAAGAVGNSIRAFNIDASGNIMGGTSATGAVGTAMGSTGVSMVSVTTGTVLGIGTNLDGDGRMYLRMITNSRYEIYKDAAMTMKVGSGEATNNVVSDVKEQNSSGIGTGLQITILTGGFQAGATSVLQFSAMAQDSNVIAYATGTNESIEFRGLSDALGTVFGGSTGNNSFFSGINLGVNTSDTGALYIRADLRTGAATSQIWVYKDAQMRDEDLVARSDQFAATSVQGINIFAVPVGNSGQTTGLYGVINIGSGAGGNNNTSISSAIVRAENIGVRISAAEYGADQFVKLSISEGGIWSRYDSNNDATLLSGGLSGADWTSYGSNAVLSLNGQRVTLQGIQGTLTNLDTTANIVFKEGSIGNTTIASVGYDVGSITARAGLLGNSRANTATNNANALHALHSTTEIISNFTGGMQFQLGEGAGDQNRTIYGVKNMTATELGKTKFYDYFGNDHKVEKYLSVNNLMSGGEAALANDAVKAMSVINMAIRDVSSLRANIGAFQANMLQTNANSLEVAMENIVKTESYIRDTDMATESTAFTKNQVLVQAGTSMLTQANSMSQRALSLIS